MLDHQSIHFGGHEAPVCRLIGLERVEGGEKFPVGGAGVEQRSDAVVGEIPESERRYPALGVGSRGGVGGLSGFDGAEVAVEGVGDVLVAGCLVGPAALLSVVDRQLR